MGKESLVGEVTRHIAAELRAERARNQWSLDEIVKKTGVSRSTVDRAMKGTSAIAVEALIPLCIGMGLDPLRLLDEAMKAAGK